MFWPSVDALLKSKELGVYILRLSCSQTVQPLLLEELLAMASPSARTDGPPLLSQPVAPPPPGVTPNLANPTSRANEIVIVTTIFTTLAMAFVMLRFYTRLFITRSLGYDDCKPTSFCLEQTLANCW